MSTLINQMDVILRPFIFPIDVDAMLEIERERFKDPFTRGQVYFYHKRYGTKGSYILERNGEVAGYIFVVEDSPGKFHIFSFAVKEEIEGKGMGTELLRKHIDYAKSHGARSIILEVRESNRRAQAIYLREKFKEKCIIDDYYDDGEKAIQMELELR